MIARVRGVSTRSIVSAVRLPLSRSTSAKTGLAPSRIAQLADAMNVRGVTTTSSPGPMRHMRRASSSATVPFMSAIARFTPRCAAYSRSNSRPSVAGPVVDLAAREDCDRPPRAHRPHSAATQFMGAFPGRGTPNTVAPSGTSRRQACTRAHRSRRRRSGCPALRRHRCRTRYARPTGHVAGQVCARADVHRLREPAVMVYGRPGVHDAAAPDRGADGDHGAGTDDGSGAKRRPWAHRSRRMNERGDGKSQRLRVAKACKAKS